MNITKYFTILLLASLAIAGPLVRSQANVTENQTVSIYVDALKGSDSNTGTSSLPLKTIQAAVNKANANNQKSIGTKVVINSGVYREFVNIPAITKQTSATMTIEAATTGTAIIAGSNVLTDWTPEPGNPSIYSHSSTYNLATCAVPTGWPSNFAPIALHAEMVFLNNVPLTQVLNYGDLRAGTFFVNEEYDLIYVWPPSSTNMQTAVVEAAVRPQTLRVQGRSNLVLRGLVFRHAASCINQTGTTVTSSSNVLIDKVQAVWNNWGGLAVSSSSNITVQNSIASHNGGVGFEGYADQNALYSFNESDYNNWRGAQAALYDWGMGGTKLMLMRNTTVQDHYSYDNQAQGLWFDTDNKNITINNATLSGNVLSSLQLEANEGPITLENSKLCSGGVGVTVINTEELKIDSNVFYNNGGTNKYQAEIFIAGKPGGRVIKDWQTGQSYDLFTSGTEMTGNTFEDASTGQNVFGTFLSGSDWSDFANTLNSSGNRWYDPITASSFKIVNGKLVGLTGWQSVTGTDLTSDWAPPATSPSAACTVPTPLFTDFAVNMDNDAYTMTSGKAVATVRVNSFAFGPVTLAVSALPAGVSASLSRNNLVSGVVTLTLTAAKTAANQNVPVTLWAYGNSRVHSATFYVHVIPAT
jgi:hypothetical protein